MKINNDENKGELQDCNLKNLKTKIWIKTLISSYRIFPKIISTIDKIVEIQATNISFSSNIFNSSNKLENQFEKVIDLSERKKSLVNIYVMLTKMINDLSYDQKCLFEYKFIDEMTNDEIAEEMGICERTVYRKFQKLINNIYSYFVLNHWTLEFIEFQIGSEDWLIDKFNHNFKEYKKLNSK